SILQILQLLQRLTDGQPLELVDFSVRTEVAVDSACRPVPDLLDALLDRITDGSESPAKVRRVPGLLVDLAHGGNRFGFAGVNLALGQRPVVVAGTVDDRDLRRGRVG